MVLSVKVNILEIYFCTITRGNFIVPENDCTHGEIIQNSADISCRSFYLCAHGYQMLMTCAPGTMFDVSCLCCNHATMVSCTSDAASTMKGNP